MQSLNTFLHICFFCICFPLLSFAGTSPCSATNYQLSDFGNTMTYTLDNGTYTNLADPTCGDYQGQDFWVTFTGPSSGQVNIELLAGSITDGAFEVHWNACNGLATSIGCFKDRNCGAEEMPGANLQVIPGETYHVRIFQEGGGGGTIGYRMSDPSGTEFNLAGSAQTFNSGNPLQNCIQLTSETTNQVGCAWFETPVDFQSGFTINYELFFGDIDAGGADGIAFVFHTDPSPPCNSSGGQLGFVGIPNSFVVEFDTWQNGNFGDNTPLDHVAVNINSFIAVPVVDPVPIGTNGNVEDGLWHDVTLTWDPITDLFQVFFDGVLVVNVNVSLLTDIFVAGNPVYWGVTGSTGAAFNNQRFCFSGFDIENSNSVETKFERRICEGDPVVFGGSVIFDEGVYEEIFTAANGCDSTVTLTVEIIDIDVMGIEEVVLPCGDDASVVQLAAIVEANVDDSTLSYAWETDDGVIDSGANTLTPIVSAVGTYTLTVEYNPEDCEEEFSVTVSIAEPPSVSTLDGFTGCPGDTLVLACNGDEGVLVEWTTLDGNIIGDPNVPNPMVDTAGTYTVTVTDLETGCTNTATSTIGSGGSGDAGPDLFFCVGDDGELYLQGSTNGDIVGFQWSPEIGLSDPNSLTPQVLDPNSLPTFSLTICNKTGLNLIENSDFSSGNTGFTSDYQEGFGAAGEYLVTGDPTDFFPTFASCGDNTPSDDNMMMVIDGDTDPNQNFWCQEVEVTAGASYMYAASFANLCTNCSNNFPLISFVVDGNSIGSPQLQDNNECEWVELESEIFTAANSIIEVCFSNAELASNGNDFAIDDIEMFEICKSDGGECTIFPYQDLELQIAPAEIACQVDQILELEAFLGGTPSGSVSFEWSAADGGSILSNGDTATPTVQGPGTYIVTLVDQETGCETETEIVLEEGDPEFPNYSLSATEITCENTSAIVSVDGLDSDVSYDFIWDGPGNNFTQNNDGSINTTNPGDYTVTVINMENNCETIQDITVDEIVDIPVVEIAPIDPLTCKDIDQEVQLNGSFSNVGSDPVETSWTTNDGVLLSFDDGSAQIMGGGTYTFIVRNELTGCIDSTDILVQEDLTPPAASIITPNNLDCINTNETININAPTGSDYSYEWAANPGNTSGETSQSSIAVNSAGIYEVVVTDNTTGCSSILSTEVFEDFDPPVYTLNNAVPLDCNISQIEIGVEGSDLSYVWQASPGIISNLNNSSVTVLDIGQYEVSIINNNNGCEITEFINVTGDFAEPNVEAGDPLTFGCSDTSLSLAGSSTDGVSAQWQTSGGILLGSENTFAPSIGGAGTYTLVVTGANGCTNSDIVIVEADNDLPVISAPESLVIDCNTLSVEIDASGSSSGADFVIEWRDSDGVLITDFTTLSPTVNAAGQYQLTIINTQNNCDASTVVNVVENFTEPSADITPVSNLSCDAMSSTFGLVLDNNDWTYAWSDANGILTGEDQFQISTATEGAYSLVITDQSNGCTNEYSFDLNSIVDEPSLDFGTTPELTCTATTGELEVSTDISNAIFAWSANGDPIMGSDQSTITIAQPGTYTVTITDPANACTATGMIEVEENADLPSITIQEPETLTCETLEVLLVGTITNIGQDVEYIWSTDDGLFNSPNGGANISAGSTGEYTLTVINNENGCSSSSTIQVDESITNFVIEIDQPTELDCNLTEVTLNGEVNTNNQIQYEWSTTDGNILSGENTTNPIVNQAGEYMLTVTDPSNGCTSQSAITVEQDSDVPELMISTPDMITCSAPQITLNAEGSSQGLDYLIQWTSSDGNIVSGENTLTPTVDMDGSYTLTITSVSNNCVVFEEVNVDIDTQAPDITLSPLENIDCDNPSVLVSAIVNDPNLDVTFLWTASTGSISGSDSDLDLVATGIGDYTLIATNTANGCTTEIPFAIEGNENVPDAAIINPARIDCENSSTVIALDLGSDPSTLEFAWDTSGGSIDGGQSDQSITATSAGTYTVTITDVQSNCEVILSTEVETDENIPSLEFIEPNTITCADPTAVINTQTDLNGLIYEWTTQDGMIMSPPNGEDIIVSTGGTYSLVITNSANACTNSIVVEVLEDIELPSIDIDPTDELNCVLTEQSLSANNSSMGPEFDYQWTSQNGQIISGGNTLNPVINAPGFYTLQITNTTNECVQIDSVFVSENTAQPLAAIETPQDLDCITELVSLSTDITNTQNLDLIWSTANGNIVTDPNQTSIDVDMPGVYELTITDQTNGCENLLITEVEQDVDVPVLELSDGFTLTCTLTEGTVSLVDFDEDAQITWLDPQMTILSSDMDISISEPGIYTAIALFPETGCETVRTVEILENDNLPTEIVADVNPPLCIGDVGSVTLLEVIGGEGPYLYSTDGGQSFGDLDILENLQAGSVSEVIAQDANGCLLPSTFVMPEVVDVEAILPPLVELSFGDDYQIQVQTNISLNEIETITWTPSTGLSCTDCLNPTVSPNNNIDYEVQITTTNGCVGLADIQFRVDRQIKVYIPNAFSPFNIDGVNDTFILYAKEGVVTNIQSLQIYDRWGTQLFVNEDFLPNVISEGWDGTYRNEDMQPGVYVYYAVVEYQDGTTELFKGDLTLME